MCMYYKNFSQNFDLHMQFSLVETWPAWYQAKGILI